MIRIGPLLSPFSYMHVCPRISPLRMHTRVCERLLRPLVTIFCIWVAYACLAFRARMFFPVAFQACITSTSFVRRFSPQNYMSRCLVHGVVGAVVWLRIGVACVKFLWDRPRWWHIVALWQQKRCSGFCVLASAYGSWVRMCPCLCV